MNKTADAAPAATGSHTAGPDFDPAPLLALPMVADGSAPHFALEMLALFAQTTAQALEQLGSAAAAGNDLEAERLLHTLKSGSAQVGAMGLAALAQRYEGALRGGGQVDAAWPDSLRDAFERARQAWTAWRPVDVAAPQKGL